jgi:hypothetical protein
VYGEPAFISGPAARPRSPLRGAKRLDSGGRAAACRSNQQLLTPVHERYDAGMTKAKIAISLPKDQLARVHREVRAGRAESVSGYIAQVLAEHEKRESLRALLRDLIAQYGEPATKDIKWAERVLAPRRG